MNITVLPCYAGTHTEQIDDGIELLPATQYPFYGQLKIPWLTVPDFQYQRFSALRMHFTTQDFSSV